MAKIRVIIADDHALVREGIRAILSHADNVEVVAEASDGSEAIRLTEKLSPDLVLMDISMPGLGGLEATQEIKKRFKDTKILVLTQYDEKEYIKRFLNAGVSGYILKKAVGEDLLSAIRAIMSGGSYLYPSIAQDVINGYLSRKTPVEIEDPFDKITQREQQVLKLIAEGLTHKEISKMLNISTKTVIAHQSNISEKLNIHSRANLMKYAIQKRLVEHEGLPDNGTA